MRKILLTPVSVPVPSDPPVLTPRAISSPNPARNQTKPSSRRTSTSPKVLTPQVRLMHLVSLHGSTIKLVSSKTRALAAATTRSRRKLRRTMRKMSKKPELGTKTCCLAGSCNRIR